MAAGVDGWAMLVVPLIACLIFCGCDQPPPANPLSQFVIDRSGTNQLALIYVSLGPGPGPDSESFDFHSLAWQIKSGTNWKDRVVVTKDDFEAGSRHKRWVSEIHSLDASSGNATIKVAEHWDTNGGPVVYSWREWNMVSNVEVRLVRVCKEPFEPYSGKRFKLFR
ncbi:MAG TPA: hypothetical protein VFE51_29850 [Verrucomicrobiae bacterium]|nr:hypothetical protein [Verrucomicrobiae bacterium]